MKKELISRIAVGLLGGIVICNLITIGISISLGDGNFYPCNRFVDFSLRDKQPRIIGNIHDGIDLNKVRPFIILDKNHQSSGEGCQSS